MTHSSNGQRGPVDDSSRGGFASPGRPCSHPAPMTPAPARSSDQHLLARVAEGDLHSFAEFYDRHAARTLGLIHGMVRHAADAEDLLQEVFAQVWAEAGRYDPQRSQPLFWLGLIARSRALDSLRRARRRGDGPGAAETAQQDGVADAAELAESAGLVRGALTRLPREQSEVIRLAFYRGFTHAEISALRGIPLGTVKTRIRLGMRRMREILAQVKVSA